MWPAEYGRECKQEYCYRYEPFARRSEDSAECFGHEVGVGDTFTADKMSRGKIYKSACKYNKRRNRADYKCIRKYFEYTPETLFYGLFYLRIACIKAV